MITIILVLLMLLLLLLFFFLRYIEIEWKVKKMPSPSYPTNLIGFRVETPTQNNYYDCGIYLLHYVETFFKNPIKNFNFPINLKNWFTFESIRYKRRDIKQLIFQLIDEQQKLTTQNELH